MVIPSLTGDGMAIALSTARHCAYGFNGRQKGLKVEDGPQQRMLEKQMHWALIGHAILKYPWAIDTGLCVPGLGAFLIEMIFKKTRVAGMKDNPHDHRETIFKNNYSRR
jgi:hypothetical protein